VGGVTEKKTEGHRGPWIKSGEGNRERHFERGI